MDEASFFIPTMTKEKLDSLRRLQSNIQDIEIDLIAAKAMIDSIAESNIDLRIKYGSETNYYFIRLDYYVDISVILTSAVKVMEYKLKALQQEFDEA